MIISSQISLNILLSSTLIPFRATPTIKTCLYNIYIYGSLPMTLKVTASASLGNLLKMHIVRPYHRPMESEILEVVPTNLWLQNSSRWSSVQFSSVTQSCLILCKSIDCSIPGFSVHHQLLELLKIMSIELVMPSNQLILCRPFLLLPSIFPSIRVFSFFLFFFFLSASFQKSQLFTSGGQSIGVSASASVLPMNIQDWFPLGSTGFISLQSKGLLRVFSNITGQKHQFFGTQLSLWCNSLIHTWLLGKP